MVPASQRHQLGQWFTPPAVADLALALALPDKSQRSGCRVLDPSCGDGVFLARARAAGVDPSGLCGIEIESQAAADAASAVPGARVIHSDLFDVEGEVAGFDAVVGNPPYVRQERLAPAFKQRMLVRLRADWPGEPAQLIASLVGRGDLAGAVIARSLGLCRPGGRLAMVVSTALIDSGYGKAVFELVGRHGQVVALVEAPGERWFHDAAVNAAILVIERAPVTSPAGRVRCARLKVATAVAAEQLGSPAQLSDIADVRMADAQDPPSWAAALRAPTVWFDYQDAAGQRLIRLGEVAEIRRGITSGANDIFYVPRARAAELGLEASCLAPLVKSPRQLGGETIRIDPDQLSTWVLLAPSNPDELADVPAVRAYLDGHGQAADRPTLRNRQPWWSLPARPARLFLTKAYASRFVQRMADAPTICDQRLYSIHPRAGVPVEALAAVLNSTFTALALESLGRSSMGEGALEWTVGDARRLPIVDPRTISPTAAAALAAMAARPIATVADEQHRSDRTTLDHAVANDQGLIELLPDIHNALIASVQRRIDRARGATRAGTHE